MTEQFTGWQVLIHKATELVGDTDGIDYAASLAGYNEAVLAAITEAFPGAEIEAYSSGALCGVSVGVSVPNPWSAMFRSASQAVEAEIDEAERAQRIVERIFESGKGADGASWYVALEPDDDVLDAFEDVCIFDAEEMLTIEDADQLAFLRDWVNSAGIAGKLAIGQTVTVFRHRYEPGQQCDSGCIWHGLNEAMIGFGADPLLCEFVPRTGSLEYDCDDGRRVYYITPYGEGSHA